MTVPTGQVHPNPSPTGSQLPVLTVAGKSGDVTLDAADIGDLATVATSGSYDDLLDAPALAAVATSGSYSDLSGAPALATVATSGSYNDLSDKPTIPALSSSNPSALGIANPGTSSSASKSDHVHTMPTASDVGLGTSSTPQFAGIGLGVAAQAGFDMTLGGSGILLRQSVTASSGTYTLDITAANEFVTSDIINGATTINLSNLESLPLSYIWEGVLTFSYTSGTITWFSGNSGYTVKWDGGSAITPTSGEVETVVMRVLRTGVGTGSIEVYASKGRS